MRLCGCDQRNLRVLHVYRTYFPDTQGGLEEVIRQICVNCIPDGVESRVLTLSKSPLPREIARPEARVFRAQQTFEIASCNVSLDGFRLFRELLPWADVVNYHYPWPFADILHFSAKVRCPTVVTYHSDIVRQRLFGALYRPLMNRFLGKVNQIVCTSPNYFATSSVLSNFANKVDVIPIGLNRSTYPEADPARTALWQQRFKEYFLFVGVLRYYKGLHILIEAMKGAPYNVVIAGSGPIEEDLRAQARRAGLVNVHFTGYVPDEDKVSLFAGSRGVVFPSYLRSEAFGVTLLEGAMFEKPLVSTEVGSGTSHVNVDGETGYVVPPGSPKALRAAMDTLFSQPHLAREMGRQARGRYERLFTGALMGHRYTKLYSSLTGRSCGTATCARTTP